MHFGEYSEKKIVFVRNNVPDNEKTFQNLIHKKNLDNAIVTNKEENIVSKNKKAVKTKNKFFLLKEISYNY